MTKAIKCYHEWVGGMMVIHPEDLAEVAAVRKVVCSKCDHQYDRHESEYTVIFDWSADSWSAEDAIMVVVLASTTRQAVEQARKQLFLANPDCTYEDFNEIITFHGDVTNLAAE